MDTESMLSGAWPILYTQYKLWRCGNSCPLTAKSVSWCSLKEMFVGNYCPWWDKSRHRMTNNLYRYRFLFKGQKSDMYYTKKGPLIWHVQQNRNCVKTYVYRVWMNNHIPKNTMKCNYLLPTLSFCPQVLGNLPLSICSCVHWSISHSP